MTKRFSTVQELLLRGEPLVEMAEADSANA